MPNERLVGGPLFANIKSDTRVTPDLTECIYCVVTDTEDNSILDGKIKLQECGKSGKMKQCPMCKRIYVFDTIVM